MSEQGLGDAAEAREALHQHEQQFRAFVQSIQKYAVFLLDPSGVISTWNAGAERIKGWKAEEVIGHNFRLLYLPEDREAGRPEENLRIATERGHYEEEGWRLRKDGTRFMAHVVITPVYGAEGRLTGFAKVTQDITEPKRVEERLRASEERLRTLIDNLPCGAVYQAVRGPRDDQTRFTFLSAGVEALFGVTPHEAVADAAILYRLIHHDDLERVLGAEERALESFSQFDCEFRHRHRSGELRWVHCRSAPRPRTTGEVIWEGVMLDVTDRKRAEESLRQQSRLTQSITDNATTAIFTMDGKGRTTFMNPSAEEMTGYTLQEAQGQILHDLIHHTRPDGSRFPMEECAIGRAIFKYGRLQKHEDVFLRKDGTLFPVRCSASPVLENGELAAIVLEVLDITDEKRAEAALQESEERFRTLADNIPQLAWMAQPDGYIFWYNRRWFEYTGTALEQMQGWGWQAVHDPQELPRVLRRIKESFATGEPWEDVFPLRRYDGEMRWHLSRMLPLKDPEGRVVRWFGTNTDITQRREMEQALRDADRRKDEFLAMLGHELRNPLAAIKGGVSLLRMPGISGSVQDSAREILAQQTDHMVRLVDDLLDVSRIVRGKIEVRKQPVTLQSTLEEAIGIARPLIEASRCQFETNIPSNRSGCRPIPCGWPRCSEIC